MIYGRLKGSAVHDFTLAREWNRTRTRTRETFQLSSWPLVITWLTWTTQTIYITIRDSVGKINKNEWEWVQLSASLAIIIRSPLKFTSSSILDT